MKVIIAELKSVSPYSQSAPVVDTKTANESHEEFEQRIWPSRLHVNADGNLFIPPMAIKNALSEAAKYLSLQIAGKGKATYTKHFEAGVLIVEGITLLNAETDKPLTPADAIGERLFLPASGKRGDGKRVWRTYPRIDHWKGRVQIHVLDEIILQKMPALEMSVLEYVLDQSGTLIGIGRFRPRNNGFYGRFSVSGFEVQK